MVHKHGDCFRPLKVGLWDPFQMAVLCFINGGDPNYLLTGWDDPPSRRGSFEDLKGLDLHLKLTEILMSHFPC